MPVLRSSYCYNDASGVLHLPLARRWPLEPRIPLAGIKRFIELTLAGTVFDPIIVAFGFDDRFSVVNGHHRTEASVWLNYTHIPALAVINEGWREANK